MSSQEQKADGRDPRAGSPLTRRRFVKSVLAGSAIGLSGVAGLRYCQHLGQIRTFVGRAEGYDSGLFQAIQDGFRELEVETGEVKGKTVLLKPNLVEPHAGAGHINTHPLFVRAAAESFLRLGAARILVAEAPGHRRDSLLVLEESGLAEVLIEDRIPFLDLNYETAAKVANQGLMTGMESLFLPTVLREADWIVSLAKMKTHHWTGVTLSMKNLFGVMPGIYYGWPKNVLHQKGIHQSIVDINVTVKPHFAIVDGIIGMEGDGPIMGEPKKAGVVVMGRDVQAVDATCSRVMGIDPENIPYLSLGSLFLGPIAEAEIAQVGEEIASVRTDFKLLDEVEAHRGLRLDAG